MKKTNYFSHDSNARNDEKIIAVRMRLGAEGYGIYFMILERLRDSADYMSVKDYNNLAFDFRVSAEKVKAVVEDFGLFTFTDDGKRFYSESFLQRMKIKDNKSRKRSEAGKKGMKIRYGKDKANNVITKNDETDNNVITKQEKKLTSKVKESKVKNNIDNTDVLSCENSKIDYAKIVDLFHELCPSLPKVLKLNDKRKNKIKLRLQEMGNDYAKIEEVFKKTEASDFLRGEKNSWRASFDWLFENSTNWVKILEGNYDNRKTVKHPGVIDTRKVEYKPF